MRKFLFSVFALLMMLFNTVSAVMSENAAISFHSLENGFRISLSNVDISQVSDCTWDGVSICAKLRQDIQAGNVKVSQFASQINIDIPVSEKNSGLFDNAPTFALIFSSGEVLSAPAAFASNDDISYSGGDPLMDSYFDEIVRELREYSANNPEANEEALNEYAKVLMDNTNTKLRRAKRAHTDMDGYISRRLNSQELALYNANMFKALRCMANGKIAIFYAEFIYESSVLHNGNGDAFRHALWNYGMGISVGYSFAKQWSDAHENGTLGNPPLEKRMDLFNNSVGLLLALDNPWTFFHSTFIGKTLEKARGGKLLRIRNGRLIRSDSVGEK